MTVYTNTIVELQQTDTLEDIRAALNRVNARLNSASTEFGNTTHLTTNVSSNLVFSINEVRADIGNVADLIAISGVADGSLAAALNHILETSLVRLRNEANTITTDLSSIDNRLTDLDYTVDVINTQLTDLNSAKYWMSNAANASAIGYSNTHVEVRVYSSRDALIADTPLFSGTPDIGEWKSEVNPELFAVILPNTGEVAEFPATGTPSSYFGGKVVLTVPQISVYPEIHFLTRYVYKRATAPYTLNGPRQYAAR